MADGHGAPLVGGVGGDALHQLIQCLLHGEGLSQLADLTLRGGPAQQLDFQGAGDHRLQLGEPPVFPQVVQRLQHKQGLHLVDELFHLPDHLFKGHAGGGQLLDLQSGQHLAGGGGTGVEYVDIALRLLLLQQDAGLFRAVVGAAEQSGQGNHIDVLPLLSLVCVQVGLGRGTGGGGCVLALAHGPEQVRLVQGVVVHKDAPVGVDGERNLHKAGVLAHLGRQVTAAVHYDLKTHALHLQTSFLKRN